MRVFKIVWVKLVKLAQVSAAIVVWVIVQNRIRNVTMVKAKNTDNHREGIFARVKIWIFAKIKHKGGCQTKVKLTVRVNA